MMQFATRATRALWLVAALAATSGAATLPAQPPNTIIMHNFDFSPMMLTVAVGTTVTWHNTDGEPHTVTSLDGLFRSGALDEDEKYTFKFTKPGTYKYVCSIHPRMTGTVVVR
jgi:plastocyanin